MGLAITFDTLRYSKKLIDAGMPVKVAEAQAEAQLEVFSEIAESTLATKQDIVGVEQKITEVKREIAESKAEIIKWVIGVMIALSGFQIAALAAFVKLVH